MLIRSRAWLLFLKKTSLLLTESELRICSFCIMQVISRGKALENLLQSSAKRPFKLAATLAVPR